MNRLYSVLSEINHAIVRATERGSLFEEICRIAVEQGGLLMAWIGLVDEDSGLVRPAAWYGKNEGYLDNIRISVFEEPEGMGPSGRAIRESDVCLTRDFLTDPTVLPWRENAQAGIPLVRRHFAQGRREGNRRLDDLFRRR